MKISTKVQYGLRAMAYLAQNAKTKKAISSKDIAFCQGIPAEYLEKIIARLEKNNIVRSTKGAAGGYVLARPAAKIKISEIFGALENQTTKIKCIDSRCSRQRDCLTKNLWCKMQQNINGFLDSINLEDLIKNKIN